MEIVPCEPRRKSAWSPVTLTSAFPATAHSSTRLSASSASELVSKLRGRFPRRPIALRGDGAFSKPNLSPRRFGGSPHWSLLPHALSTRAAAKDVRRAGPCVARPKTQSGAARPCPDDVGAQDGIPVNNAAAGLRRGIAEKGECHRLKITDRPRRRECPRVLVDCGSDFGNRRPGGARSDRDYAATA